MKLFEPENYALLILTLVIVF